MTGVFTLRRRLAIDRLFSSKIPPNTLNIVCGVSKYLFSLLLPCNAQLDEGKMKWETTPLFRQENNVFDISIQTALLEVQLYYDICLDVFVLYSLFKFTFHYINRSKWSYLTNN